jgi:hypothetical protein
MDSLISDIEGMTEGYQHKLLNYLLIKKKHRQKSVDLERYLYLLNRCQAKTSNGKECSRRCLNVVSDYCHCHVENPDKYQNVKPKKSQTKTVSIDWEQVDMNDYVKCRLVQLDGVHYLIDDKGVLFDRKDYTIVGYREEGVVTWFYEK